VEDDLVVRQSLPPATAEAVAEEPVEEMETANTNAAEVVNAGMTSDAAVANTMSNNTMTIERGDNAGIEAGESEEEAGTAVNTVAAETVAQQGGRRRRRAQRKTQKKRRKAGRRQTYRGRGGGALYEYLAARKLH
jgi:hypothetical protein